MGPRGWWIRLVGIALMAVLFVALAQTATPPATASEAYVVVTSAEQIIGTWMRPARYRRFDEDGAYRSASSATALDGAPSAINSYRFEGGEMLVTEVAVSDVPSCGEVVGRYEVRLLGSGDLQIVVIKDPCHARAGSTAWVYERVE